MQRGLTPAGGASPPTGVRPERSNSVLKGKRDTTLPGDVVLRLVESVAIERVHEVTTFGPNPQPSELVLEPGTKIPGELGPRAVRRDLMDADGTGAAQQVRAQRSGPGLNGVAQHEIRVVGELVELAPAGQAGAAQAVLRPAATGADPDVPLQPHGAVEGADPAQTPVRGAGRVQIGRAGQPAEAAADGKAGPRGLRVWHDRVAHLGRERGGRERQNGRDYER